MAAFAGLGLGVAGSVLGAIGSGPSSQVEAINNEIQQFSQQMTKEAGTEMGDANSVFNGLMKPLQTIVNGGPSQMGFSQSELNALNSQTIARGAAMARNISAGAGAGTSTSPLSPTSEGGGQQASAVLAAKAAAEAATANQENQNTVAGYEQGNKNFETAVGDETKLPSVFATSNEANKDAAGEQVTAEKSQQEIDTAKRAASWQGIISKGMSAAGGMLTGGKVPGLGGNQLLPGSDSATYGSAPSVAGGSMPRTPGAVSAPSGIDPSLGAAPMPDLFGSNS
jgi:hypothetical protein